MKAVSDNADSMATMASMSAKVLADAQRSFVDVDAATLEQNVQEIVSLLWAESVRVTTVIPVLALRDLRERFAGELEPPQA